MKLRDHPLVHWPEVWIQIHAHKHITATGQMGNLINVIRIPESRMLVLGINYAGERYMGALLCEDLKLAEKIHDLLLRHVGEPVRDIGDLDILREL
jgi:hypothetical protein